MKNHLSDRRWITLILVLLVVEIAWLFADLDWIELPFFKKLKSQIGTTEAGYVLKSKSDLKRRGANSLIWEPIKESETLFYKDSVLTLSESSAKLYLKDQTELTLSENTLVTLEEPENKKSSEIRLRFSKGDLKARNPNYKTTVQGEDWIVALEKGAEVSFRKAAESYEFEVLTGQASLQSGSSVHMLDQNKVIKLNQNKKIEAVKKTQALHWKDKTPVRVYIFEGDAHVPLKWEGAVKNVSIHKAGEAETKNPVKGTEDSAQLTLTPGNYKIRLQGEDGVSEAKDIEVWQAPKIFPQKPLPRDRVVSGQMQEFVWTKQPGVKEYVLQFKRGKEIIKTEKSTDNFKNIKFEDEEDLTWTVQGLDEEGFPIPGFIEEPLFIREAPLLPPKLKTPSIQEADEQKQNGAFHKFKIFFEIFFAKAQAQATKQRYQVIFEWEPVSGANKYVIEVSSTPDFRTPEVIQSVSDTKFTWKSAKYKKYYWRVASANSRGKMGLFSEPMEIKLEELRRIEAPQPLPASKPIVKAEPVPELEKKLERKPEPNMELPIPKPEPVVVTPEPSLPWLFRIAYAPSAKSTAMESDTGSKLKLTGGSAKGLQTSLRSKNLGANLFQLSLKVSSQTWKPDPPEAYPQQENLTTNEIWGYVDYWRMASNHRAGLVLNSGYIPVNTSATTIAVERLLNYGLRYSYGFENIESKHQGLMGVSYLLGDRKMQHTAIDFEYRYYFNSEKMNFKVYTGTAGTYSNQKFETGRGTQINVFFLLGFEKF